MLRSLQRDLGAPPAPGPGPPPGQPRGPQKARGARSPWHRPSLPPGHPLAPPWPLGVLGGARREPCGQDCLGLTSQISRSDSDWQNTRLTSYVAQVTVTCSHYGLAHVSGVLVDVNSHGQGITKRLTAFAKLLHRVKQIGDVEMLVDCDSLVLALVLVRTCCSSSTYFSYTRSNGSEATNHKQYPQMCWSRRFDPRSQSSSQDHKIT